MSIYNSYYRVIESAMKGDRSLRTFSKSLNESLESVIQKGISLSMEDESPFGDKLLPELQDLADQFGVKPSFNQKLGEHPDFAHLKGTSYRENHYVVSMFIDIKGSTNLFRKYDGETAMNISNTIQCAAIHTCLVFGGYIHRLQGDGLFVYFGGKNTSPEEATIAALRSAAMFSYFVKQDLKNLFDEQGIENIYTRIGIDLGHDDDVVWGSAGIGDISEVTTCSLHTSLAPKMQANALSNGVVVGDHVKASAESVQDYFTLVCKRTNNENDRYIFRIPDKNFYYSQHDFNWLSFLKQQDFIATDSNGDLHIKTKNSMVYNNRSVQNLIPIAARSKPYYNFE